MFDPEMVTFLESGCALIVGTVSPAGEPHATRGWGLDVTAGSADVRLLVAADDLATHQHLADGGPVAITGGSVLTLHSVQLKGRAVAVESATEDDRRRSERYCDEFFEDIVTIDGTERSLIERLRPTDIVACRVHIDEVFDQTPGPEAGAPMDVRRA